MASSSLTWLPIIILIILMLIHDSESQQTCPDTIHFSCPDNIQNGEFNISHFTNTSVDPFCGGPCELRCDYTGHTRIKCSNDDPEEGFQIVYMHPVYLDIVVDCPNNWLPPDSPSYDPCVAYSLIDSSFPDFQSVSLVISGSGENQTFFGCPYHQGHDYWDQARNTGCRVGENGDRHPIVYGPYYHGQIPVGMPLPNGCMQFIKYYSSAPELTAQKEELSLALEIVLPSIGVIAGMIIGLCYRFRPKKSSAHLNVEAFLEKYGSFAPQRYAYSDVKRMTSSFKEKVGQGGFGAVYKGRLMDGRLVAVKMLNKTKGDNGEEFINEVASIGRTNHINVVTLLGFCFQHDKRALVYEFMPNGSLDKFTKAGDHHLLSGGSKSLTWKTMFEISLGIARGLEYLHRGCQTRILHFDIKPHNILLDENFCPKISDFGLAKLYPQDKQSKVTMSEARGTIGYIAPEVFNRGFGQVSHKSDVYSYGMMVLEVIGSRRRENDGAQTSNSEMYFPRRIYKQMDSGEEIDDVVSAEDKEVKRKLILVSLWCIQTVPTSRPSMSRVVQMLEGQLDTAEIPPMPTLSSPPRLNLYPSASCSDSFTNSSQG